MHDLSEGAISGTLRRVAIHPPEQCTHVYEIVDEHEIIIVGQSTHNEARSFMANI